MLNRIIISLLTLLALCSLRTEAARPAEAVNIWEGTACTARVRMTPYLAPGRSNIACIVCPGGSYFWLDRGTEGHDVARRLQAEGISAFVLEYRVAGVPAFITHYRLLARGNRYPDMLQDVQRAVQLVRERAEAYGVDPDRVGVMGFSAGGHLAAMSGIYYAPDILNRLAIRPSVSLRPDFVAPIYPVVSMTADCTHRRSRRGALGEGRDVSAALKDSLSLERRVHPGMPPAFLLNCNDDPVVDCHNAELLDSAMTACGVPHVYLRYRTGGHGFGMTPSKTSAEAAGWSAVFVAWVKSLFNQSTACKHE